MSVRVMTKVWELDLPDSEKLVLLALADAANDEGLCWPSMATLVRKCSKTDRTIQTAIKSLVASGYLQREENPGKGCKYVVTPEAASPRSERTPEKSSPPKRTTLTPEAVSDKPSRTITSPTVASQPTESARASRADFPMPAGTDPEHWRDFLANRKRKNLPNTATAHKRMLADLARLTDDDWPPGKLIEYAAGKGWAAIYPPDEQDPPNGRPRQPDPRQSPSGLRGSRPDPALDLLRTARAAEAAEGAGGDWSDRGGTWTALPAIGSG